MLFPTARLKFVTTYHGKTDPSGWLVLDLTGVDLDGVNKVYIPYEQLDRVKAAGDKAHDKLKQAMSLLGGNADDDES